MADALLLGISEIYEHFKFLSWFTVRVERRSNDRQTWTTIVQGRDDNDRQNLQSEGCKWQRNNKDKKKQKKNIARIAKLP